MYYNILEHISFSHRDLTGRYIRNKGGLQGLSHTGEMVGNTIEHISVVDKREDHFLYKHPFLLKAYSLINYQR